MDAIYAEFTDRDVRRVSDGKQMTYWAYDNKTNSWAVTAKDSSELLASHSGNGACQSWSDLFHEIIKLQSIDAKCLLLLSRYASQETGAFEVLLVKNWSFEETTGEVEIPLVQKKEGSNEVVATTMRYSHLLKKSSDYSTLGIATPMNTILGQGNISGPTNFNFHWIVEANGFLYDPSYGTKKAADMPSYEEQAFAGYCLGGNIDFARRNQGGHDVWYYEN